ncbi:MAG: ATP-dependent helicase RhlE [Bradyrhizobium sp.]|nr:ATP-dependent helicase RhlE [Bradyrhizobium sp.]
MNRSSAHTYEKLERSSGNVGPAYCFAAGTSAAAPVTHHAVAYGLRIVANLKSDRFWPGRAPDTLAGGAGFSPQLAPRGTELFEAALSILEDCPETCDASCYRCLRSFRNRLDHALLDRHVGVQLLRHVITGATPSYSNERATKALRLLADDLERQFSDLFDVVRAFEGGGSAAPLIIRRKTDGTEVLVDIHSPVAPGAAVFGTNNPSAIVVDELMVRRHLGEAVGMIAKLL